MKTSPRFPFPWCILTMLDADGYAVNALFSASPRRGHTRVALYSLPRSPLFWTLDSVLASPGTMLAVSMYSTSKQKAFHGAAPYATKNPCYFKTAASSQFALVVPGNIR
ncbi:hypothetical protein V8E53_010620 [Lactarius tabidus]